MPSLYSALTGAEYAAGTNGTIRKIEEVVIPDDGEVTLKDTPSGDLTVVDGDNVDFTLGDVGVKQSMTKTVTTKATTAGAVTVTITAAGSMALANGKDVTVTLDTTSVNSNATSIRGALGADEDVSAYFVVSGTGADVVLTRKVAAANEVMSFAFEDTGTTGAKMGATTDVAGVADPTAGEYTFATDTVTFAVEDAGKLVYIAYDVATTNAQKMTLETSTNADVFRVIVTGEAILAENEGVTVLDQLTIDRAKVTGEVKMPDRSKEPKGWNFTLKLLAPRAGYKAVDYKYVM